MYSEYYSMCILIVYEAEMSLALWKQLKTDQEDENTKSRMDIDDRIPSFN